MSAADEAWQEWDSVLDVDADLDVADFAKAAFMFAYRRALEDAADELEVHPRRNALAAPTTPLWLRARAAAVAPRETKD